MKWNLFVALVIISRVRSTLTSAKCAHKGNTLNTTSIRTWIMTYYFYNPEDFTLLRILSEVLFMFTVVIKPSHDNSHILLIIAVIRRGAIYCSNNKHWFTACYYLLANNHLQRESYVHNSHHHKTHLIARFLSGSNGLVSC